MAADDDTRDAKIADDIATAETTVEGLAQLLGRLSEHATAQEATAHATMYETIQGHLSAAAKDLGRAHSIMLNGEATDYE